MNPSIPATEHASAGAYFKTLMRMATRPAAVYTQLAEDAPPMNPLAFLLMSSLVFASGSTIQAAHSPWFTFMAALTQALVVTALAAVIGHLLLKLLSRNHSTFGRTFSIFAYAGGAVLTVAWLPAFAWFAEITRWLFIGIGLVKAGGVGKARAAIIVLVDFCLVLTAVWCLASTILAAGG